MWKILDNANLKTLIIIRSAEYERVSVETPYIYHKKAGNSSLINYDESLTVSGVCEALLFADYCLRNKLVFDEIHYQFESRANMPTSQMAGLLSKSGVTTGKNKLKMSNDLSCNFGLFKEYFGISSESKLVLYIVNNNGFAKQVKNSRAKSENTEGFVLQSQKWEDVFEKSSKRIRLKTTLARRPSIVSKDIFKRIKLKNPEFVKLVQDLNLREPGSGLVCSNEKIFDINEETIKMLIQNIKKHYSWYLQR